MSVILVGDQLRTLRLGNKVDRTTGGLPASTTASIFTVTGGRIVVTSLIGLVTTSIQAQANALKIVATPTTGAVNDLCTTVETNGLAAGGLLSPLGLAGDALVKSTGGGISLGRNEIIVAVGAIGVNTAATNTGAIQWSLTYYSYDNGATVVAA